MIFLSYYESPVGTLTLAERSGKLSGLFFGVLSPQADQVIEETPLLRQAKRQLEEYFTKKRRQFSLPLSLQGTAFQQRVWRALQEIPYGQTRTYQQIAQRVDCPKGYRAVGMANHANPISIIVPCHRVVNTGGGLGGYGGGIAVKRQLLALEQSVSS